MLKNIVTTLKKPHSLIKRLILLTSFSFTLFFQATEIESLITSSFLCCNGVNFIFITILFSKTLINKCFSKNTYMLLNGFECSLTGIGELSGPHTNKFPHQFGCMLYYSVFGDLNCVTETLIQK